MSIQLARANTALKQPVGTPWPETFTPGRIAWLLTWTNDSTKYKEWNRDCRIWEAMIKDACERGELASTTTTKTIQVSEARFVENGRITPNALGGQFASLRQGYMVPAKTEEITTRHITAQNAARWLEGQDHPPGETLAAWFKAQGVDRTAVDVVAPPAPAKKETVPERNARWLKVWDEESPMHAPSSQARAIAKIVAAEGVERATVKKALQTAEKAREEARRGGNVSSMPKNKKAPASPFPTTVHRMK